MADLLGLTEPELERSLQSFEAMGTTHPVMQHHITEDFTLWQQCCDNLNITQPILLL
jgi:hypothetical protein